MEHISKKNSLETAKNRLDISGLTYVENTKYVYDRILDKQISDVFVNYIPLVETDEGYVLRYKNLMRQYYWLINKFIPSCSYEKLCMRNGEKTWIHYENACDALRKYLAFNFYENNTLIASISVASGNTATPFTPSKIGYNFSGWTTENGGNEFFDFNTPIGENTSVYAKYVIKQIELIFVLDNGEEPRSVVVDYGTTKDEILQILVDEGIVPEKEGYTFAGWYPNITTATKNATYDATYTQDIYIIRFFNIIDAEHVLDYYENQPINGGDVSEYRLIKTETHALHDQSTYYTTRPSYQHFECIEDDGYTWWVDSGGTPISASTFLDVTNSILDVYPKLTKKKYEVSFLDWDNSVIETGQTVEYLSGATAPGNPSRGHYTFTGWDRPYSSITNDTIIHATYIGEDINVIYKLPDIGGVLTVYSSVTTTYGLTAPTVAPPSLETYPPEDFGLFGGWYSDSAYTTPFDYTDLLEEDTVIYGKWKTEMGVAFYNWDGTLITGDTQGFANPVYVGYGEDVPSEALALIEDNILEMPGHEYLGWNKPTTGITNDVKITATFDATLMCVVRFINGTDESVISTTIVPAGSTILVSDYPSAPEVEHMIFNRWEGSTTQVRSNVDIYAIYEYEDITVYFVDYNNNRIGAEAVKYGQTGYTPTFTVGNISAMGYNGNEEYIQSTLRFNGTYCLVRDEFDTETGCSTPEETIITDINNTFIAQYDEIATAITTCNIRFYNYDSAYWFTDTVLYGTVIDSAYTQNILDVFASEGYIPDLSTQTFYAWVDDQEMEYVIGVNEFIVNGDVSLRAKYKMISYKVQFYVQSNPTYYPDVIDMPIQSLETEALKGTAINRPDCSNVPERVYFETFCDGMNNRWYSDSACTNEWRFKQDVQMNPVSNPYPVTGDTILYGKYVGIEYTLTYNTNGGSSITQETYRYPIPTVRPNNPTKTDSTFIGWYTDDDTFENEFIFGQPLTRNTTIYAKWFEAPEENTILYNAAADLSQYMPDMGSAHILRAHCTWDMMTGDGLLLYDAPIETFNIGTQNRSSNITVNTEIKRNLRTITIPSQVTDVVFDQFEDCRYLTAINVSEQNEKYSSEDGVLYSLLVLPPAYIARRSLICYPQAKDGDNFTIIYLNDGHHRENISSMAFANCKNLKSIALIGSINNGGNLGIENGAFKNCVNLKEITSMISVVNSQALIPTVSENAFDGVDVEHCKLNVQCQYYNKYNTDPVWGQFDIQCFGTVIYLNDNSELVIEDDILSEQAVDDALSETHTRLDIIGIEIGNNVTGINALTFDECCNLTSVTIGNNVTYIEEFAFNNCNNLLSIGIPDSVISIGASSFNDCQSLTSVTFGNGLRSIGNVAFEGCYSLTSLYLPYTLQEIYVSAFSNCTSLMSITCDRVTPPTLSAGAFDNTNSCPIYVPCDSLSQYQSAPNWSAYSGRMECIGTILYLSDSSTVVITANTLTQELIRDVYSDTLVACEIGDNVTEIGEDAFFNCNSLTSVTFGNSVTSIGMYAFEYCFGLTSIEIPNSVTSIRTGTFFACSSLASIEIPNSVTSIGSNTFSSCTSLTSVTIPNSVTSIGDNAFFACSSLASIEIPNSVTSIGSNTFSSCSGLASVTFSNSVTSIGYGTFSNCTSLTSVTIPNSVTSIGDMAFNSCSSLTSIEIPNSITSIGYGTFSNCTSLTSVTIPNSVTNIRQSAFYNCTSLTSIEIPDSVTSIGDNAFSSCSSLTSVTIPNSVTNIGGAAFLHCTGLEEIVCEPTTPPTLGVQVFYDTNNCPIYVPCESVNAYKAATNWSTYESRIQCIQQTGTTLYLSDSSTVVITADTLTRALISDVYSGTVVACEVGENVTEIEENAFLNCTSLETITIPSSVTTICREAFYMCNSLISVTIPNGVTRINDNTFSYCYSLTSVTMPDSVTSIGFDAFFWCSGLTSIAIPDTVSNIDGQAFMCCRSITSITIPSTLTTIEYGSFRGCVSLTNIIIPSGVTSIEDYAFEGCSGLTRIICYSITPPTLPFTNTIFDNTNNCPIYVPGESVETYKAADGWRRYASRITDGSILPPSSW